MQRRLWLKESAIKRYLTIVADHVQFAKAGINVS